MVILHYQSSVSPEICLHDHKVVRNHGDPAGCGKNRTFCAACDAMQMKSNSTEKRGRKTAFIHFIELQPSSLTPDKQTGLPS